MRHAIAAALLGAALLSGCGSDDGDGPAVAPTTPAAGKAASAPTDTISIKDFKFVPEAATVKAGQKIAVVNDDSAPHTLTDQPKSGKPMFDTGNVTGKQTGSFVAPKAGTYTYFCELHAFMKGELEVVE